MALAAPEITSEERVDRVALVAPPGPSAFVAPYRAFLPVGIDRAAVTRASKAPAILVSSDNDPYCPEGLDAYKSIFTDDLEMEHQVLRGAGHISVDEGYGPWPAILKWCTSGLSDWTSQTQHGDNQAGNEPKQTDPADSYSPLKFGLDG